MIDPEVVKEFSDKVYKPGDDIPVYTLDDTELKHRIELTEFLSTHHGVRITDGE